ncbi:Guanine nucleotide exchange factor [Naviculisporaceae sp. PSN 640]
MSQFAQFGSPGLTGPAKLKAVTALVDKLTTDLKTSNLSSKERDRALEELKVFGREPQNADPIFTKQGIETLTKYAFDSKSSTTSQNALRVICNALLLKPEVRQIFVDLGCEPKACEKLKNDNRDDEFLISRIIFLTTYGTSVDIPKLIEKHGLAESIVENLSRHVARSSSSAGKTTDPMEGMALIETLKLLFNVTRFAASHLDSFAPAIPHLVTLVITQEMPSTGRPLDGQFSQLVNALMNLKLDMETAKSALFPSDKPTILVDRLLQLLDASMKSYKDQELEQVVTPLICVISSLHEHAPEGVRAHIRSKLLPTEEDRKTVLGKSETLPSKLLRNWTNPVAPEFCKAISHLFFDMSDKDAGKFIENVGYGFASGFLFQNNIAIPEGYSGEAATAGSSMGGKMRDVNPITGQFRDEEKFPDIPEMTDEEKEREAERLFVLFERLKQNGIISVENPVAQAYREGRFEELPDDYEDSDDDDDGKKKGKEQEKSKGKETSKKEDKKDDLDELVEDLD